MEDKKEKIDKNPYCYEEDEIDLYELWFVLKKRWKIVLFTTFLFLSFGILYIFLKKPVYRASAYIKPPYLLFYIKPPYLLLSTSTNDSNNLFDINNLLHRYIISIQDLYNLLKAKYDKSENLEFSIDRKNPNLLKIYIYSSDPEKIPEIFKNFIKEMYRIRYINTVINQSKLIIKQKINKLKDSVQYLKKYIDETLNSTNIGCKMDFADMNYKLYKLESELIDLKQNFNTISKIHIVKEPNVPKEPYKPKKALIISVATISGLFLGIFLAFFLEWLENAKRRYGKGKNNAS